jgi:hypothetical protein
MRVIIHSTFPRLFNVDEGKKAKPTLALSQVYLDELV